MKSVIEELESIMQDNLNRMNFSQGLEFNHLLMIHNRIGKCVQSLRDLKDGL